jgi:hypothetical protein
LSIPQIGSNVQNGGVVRINPFSATVEATYPVQFCGPAGLTLGPNQNLFIGCNKVFDTNGNVWDPNGAVPADPRDVIINANNGAIVSTSLVSARAMRSGSIPATITTTPQAAAAPKAIVGERFDPGRRRGFNRRQTVAAVPDL